MLWQRDCRHSEAAVGCRIFHSQITRYAFHVGARLFECDTRLQSPNDVQVSRLTLLSEIFGEGLRRPDLFVYLQKVQTEIGFHNTDDNHRLLVERQGFTDDRGITAKTALP